MKCCGRASGLAVVTLLTLSGCSVAVPEPTPDRTAQPICTALIVELPKTVLDQSRRRVTPGVYGAAWGRPAITLRCGVAKPPGLTPASECTEVNGVGWYAEPATGGTLFTTIGRPAFVELAVPSRYAPEVNALVDVAAAVAAVDPVQTPCA